MSAPGPAALVRLRSVGIALGVMLMLGAGLVPAASAAVSADLCLDPTREIVHTPLGTITDKYSPPVEADTTYVADATIWLPGLDTYPIGIDSGAVPRICWLGGRVFGPIPEYMTWETAHDYNQPCIRIVATGWMLVDGLRCDNTDDGLRPRETSTGADNVTMTVRNTYFTRIHDDCLENDGIIGGLLQDNLWRGCNMGISEQPGGEVRFSQPAGETLVLDHMLMGLRISPHEGGAGEGSLFKWSSSANDLVIKCSLFKVDEISLNHATSMEVPARIDDSDCPGHPTTIVWLGGGPYPGELPDGIRVTSQPEVWNTAVLNWRCAHGYEVLLC